MAAEAVTLVTPIVTAIGTVGAALLAVAGAVGLFRAIKGMFGR